MWNFPFGAQKTPKDSAGPAPGWLGEREEAAHRTVTEESKAPCGQVQTLKVRGSNGSHGFPIKLLFSAGQRLFCVCKTIRQGNLVCIYATEQGLSWIIF